MKLDLSVDPERRYSRADAPCKVCGAVGVVENYDNFQCQKCSYVDWDTHDKPHTGIFVRAQHQGDWGSYDIAELDRESLLAWFNARDPDVQRQILLLLLGHLVPPCF